VEALNPTADKRDKAAIVAWTRAQVARILDVSPSEIDTHQSLMSYGLDSSAAIAMTEMLSTWLGREVDPALLLEHPTIDKLATVLDARKP
jgi:aryl carrier-like protein